MLPLTIIVSPCKASFQAFLINGIALSLSYLAFMAILGKCIMGLLWRRIPSATSHNREQLLSGLEIKKYKYVCQNKAIFNWAAKGLFFLRGRGGYTHSGYYKTLSPTIA